MEIETNLELDRNESEDDAAFEAAWSDWQLKYQIPIAEDHLRNICRLWFGRGVAQGCAWGVGMVERVLGKENSA